MAESEAQESKQEEVAVPQFDPKDNSFVFVVVLVDMADDIRDVIGVIHLCASDPTQATQKALFVWKAQGLTKPEGRYVVQIGIVGALPGSQPRVLRPGVQMPSTSQILRGK